MAKDRETFPLEGTLDVMSVRMLDALCSHYNLDRMSVLKMLIKRKFDWARDHAEDSRAFFGPGLPKPKGG